MGIGKENSPRGQTVNVRGLRVRMAVEAPYPIIQIVYGDEKDVGLFCFSIGKKRQGQRNPSREVMRRNGRPLLQRE